MGASGSGAEVVFPAPAAAPPRLGLLSSVVRPQDTTGGRWVNGITFDPEACLGDFTVPGGYWWTACEANGAPTVGEGAPASKTNRERPERVTWDPYQIVDGDSCAVVDAEVEARARRVLAANQAAKVERELWAGAVAQAAGSNSVWIASPSATTLTAAPLVYALASLTQYLADTIPGRGMIHCTPRTATLWLSAGVIRREGGVLLDVMDNLVVPGTGYTGSDPNGNVDATGDTAWAYATSMVHYLESDVEVLTDVDRDRNVRTVRAERWVMAWWDLCAHAGIEVNLCEPCCTPSGGGGD